MAAKPEPGSPAFEFRVRALLRGIAAESNAEKRKKLELALEQLLKLEAKLPRNKIAILSSAVTLERENRIRELVSLISEERDLVRISILADELAWLLSLENKPLPVQPEKPKAS